MPRPVAHSDTGRGMLVTMRAIRLYRRGERRLVTGPASARGRRARAAPARNAKRAVPRDIAAAGRNQAGKGLRVSAGMPSFRC
jgi:hypothetical protein